MPRYPRETTPDVVHHVISRYVNREYRVGADEERADYLSRVAPAIARLDTTLFAYVLMSTHLHWALMSGADALWRLFKPLHCGFASWLNRTQGRLGPVFAERYRDRALEPEQLARVIAYVHNNPVRAGLVEDPADSTWSSHRAFIGLEEPPPWLRVERALSLCGFDSSPSGRLAFHDFVRARSGEPRDPDLSDGALSHLRAEVRSVTGSPVEVGTPTVGADTTRFPIVARPVTPVRPRWRGTTQVVLDVVAFMTGVPAAELQSGVRTRRVVDGRRVALLTWTEHLGRPAIEMASTLRIGSSAASMLLHEAPSRVAGLRQLAASVAEVCWTRKETERLRTVPG